MEFYGYFRDKYVCDTKLKYIGCRTKCLITNFVISLSYEHSFRTLYFLIHGYDYIIYGYVWLRLATKKYIYKYVYTINQF